MKNLVSTILSLLLFTGILSAQEKYHILHVKGEIKVKGSSELLKAKDVLTSDQEIVFGSKDAMAAAISSKRGRFLIKINSEAQNQSELVALVKDVLLESSGKLSSRNSLNTYFELQNYLKGEHVFLGDSAFIMINTENMPMNDQQFFFLRYNYNGESINKRLTFSDKKLFFIPTEIFQIDEQPISPSDISKPQLVHYNVLTHNVQETGVFNLVFPDNDQLIKEIQILQEVYAGESDENMRKEVYAYISEIYGKVYEPGFTAWYDINF